jgi:hypothetical protein
VPAEEAAATLSDIAGTIRDLLSNRTDAVSSTTSTTATAVPSETAPPSYTAADHVDTTVPAAPANPSAPSEDILRLTARLEQLRVRFDARKLVPGIAPGTVAEMPSDYVPPTPAQIEYLMGPSIPPDDRWYLITQGFNPGVYRGW